MPRFKLTLAYDGSGFHGWQRQEPPDAPPLRTVQGVLQETVREVLGVPVELTGASRTDAGVHARGQVAAFTAAVPVPADRLPRALTARLPPDVEVLAAEEVGDSFDPISGAKSKGYRYTLRQGWPHAHRAGVFERGRVFVTVHRLDAGRMSAAATRLVGTHDFRAMAREPEARLSSVRTIHSCTIREGPEGLVQIDVSGNGFLHNMVRIIAGTLVEVGRGRIEPDAIGEILASGDRDRAGPTLPPDGLCLEWVHYGAPA